MGVDARTMVKKLTEHAEEFQLLTGHPELGIGEGGFVQGDRYRRGCQLPEACTAVVFLFC